MMDWFQSILGVVKKKTKSDTQTLFHRLTTLFRFFYCCCWNVQVTWEIANKIRALYEDTKGDDDSFWYRYLLLLLPSILSCLIERKETLPNDKEDDFDNEEEEEEKKKKQLCSLNFDLWLLLLLITFSQLFKHCLSHFFSVRCWRNWKQIWI